MLTGTALSNLFAIEIMMRDTYLATKRDWFFGSNFKDIEPNQVELHLIMLNLASSRHNKRVEIYIEFFDSNKVSLGFNNITNVAVMKEDIPEGTATFTFTYEMSDAWKKVIDGNCKK